tara:strand:- start:4662 stop:5243 length:582 start_codon:yes stop_codon:yes gene_type:complete
MGTESDDSEDYALNIYLAGVLSSRVKSPATPTKFSEISEIVQSRKGDRERILNLQREGDQGLVFHGIFTENPQEENYFNVGVAYSSAASICDKIGDSRGETFFYLDENLELCIDLFHHISVHHFSNVGSMTSAQAYRMTLPTTPEDALNSFLDYSKMYGNESNPQKKAALLFSLKESRKIAQKLNPKMVFPEI